MIKNMIAGIFCAALIVCPDLFAQYTVKCEQDTILAGEGEAKIDVSPAKANAGFSCVARKGGGTFSEFKQVESAGGSVSQATFTSPFPGEVEVEVMDSKYNKIGKTTLVVVAPTVEILEQESLDKFNGGLKTMPLYVRVKDNRGRLIKTAKLVCKLSEIVNKKSVATTSKVTEFVLRENYYEAELSGLKDAAYKVEVMDVNHLEAFDKAENADLAHPSSVIEGLNISVR
jgi:hypothetical protein